MDARRKNNKENEVENTKNEPEVDYAEMAKVCVCTAEVKCASHSHVINNNLTSWTMIKSSL